MVKLSPSEGEAKWATNIKRSGLFIEAGVNRVDKSPGIAAAENMAKLKANLIKSLDDGSFEAALRNVGLAEWQKAMIEKGIPRINKGVDQAKEKTVAVLSKLYPFIESGQQKVEVMPKVTLDDSIARAETFIRHMAGFKK